MPPRSRPTDRAAVIGKVGLESSWTDRFAGEPGFVGRSRVATGERYGYQDNKQCEADGFRGGILLLRRTVKIARDTQQ